MKADRNVKSENQKIYIVALKTPSDYFLYTFSRQKKSFSSFKNTYL